MSDPINNNKDSGVTSTAVKVRISVRINGRRITVRPPWQNASLLMFLREELGLTGSKFGCGEGYCGACTVHVEGNASRSCLLPMHSLNGANIRTIEGLATQTDSGERLHPVQQAWVAHNVPQCGYCQAGQIMTAAALLATTPHPTSSEVQQTMDANLCRCGTYNRVKAAVLTAAELQEAQGGQ